VQQVDYPLTLYKYRCFDPIRKRWFLSHHCLESEIRPEHPEAVREELTKLVIHGPYRGPHYKGTSEL
jgi:hypothetical protein